MKTRLSLLLPLSLLLAAGNVHAASYLISWTEGDYVYAQAFTEQDYSMWNAYHTQRAQVSITSADGTVFSSDSGYVPGSASAFISAPIGGGGWFDMFGLHDVWCAIGGAILDAFSSSRRDHFGYSLLCLQQVPGTCSTNNLTGWVSCTYVPITHCDWLNCSVGTAALIVGASEPRISFKKRWRETPAGLDCYGKLDLVGVGCDSCTQSYDGRF